MQLLSGNMIGILFALSAAIFWGSGDFSGGLATRRGSQFQVLTLSALSGIAVLAAAALIWHEPFPSLQGIIWSVLAGGAAAVGISSLYRALSLGNTAIVAPTSAVIGAALPVCFTLLTRGTPEIIQLAGFVLAFAGIWLVSRSAASEGGDSRRGFLLALLAGISFGAFFISITQVEPDKVFTPLILTRSVMFITSLVLLRTNRLPFPSVKVFRVALLAGALDAGGNVLFLLARQFTRLDIAVIISSLYPAGTVLLAGMVLKEKISRWQKTGVIICLLAIALITL
jgi:drug/metabolite transporter (DMT)-like permease